MVSSPSRKDTSRAVRGRCTGVAKRSWNIEKIDRLTDPLHRSIRLQPGERAVFAVIDVQTMEAHGNVSARGLRGGERLPVRKVVLLKERGSEIGDGKLPDAALMESQAETMQILAPIKIRLAQDGLRVRACEFVEMRHVVRMGAPGVDHDPGDQDC